MDVLLSEPTFWRQLTDVNTRRAASGNPGILGCAGHFKKTLYDYTQLARVYLHAWILNSSRIQAVTGNEFFRTIIAEILD